VAENPGSDGNRSLTHSAWRASRGTSMIDRRTLLAGGVVVAAGSVARAQGARPLVVFLGDQASAECQTWRSQWEPLFVSSAGYKKVDYRVIYPADSSLLLRQDIWPPHLRWVLDTFLASEDGVRRGKITPRFFLVQNRQITFTATGIAGWRDAMWPMILSVTGTSA
jgi:hypothetical protein